MEQRKLHENEVEIGADLVRRLVRAQFPAQAELAIEAVESTGTVNAIYRLGDELSVRLPRVPRGADHLEKEVAWLPVLAPRLTLGVPRVVAAGEPGYGYPFRWAVYHWIEGETFGPDRVRSEKAMAAELAAFVAEIRTVDPNGAPAAGRRPLRQLDEITRSAIAAAGEDIDGRAASEAWAEALAAPAWSGNAVWRHGDLLPPNLLVERGGLTAVIDFGSAGVGDPAEDVVPAWSVFGSDGRAAYRRELDVDDGTWERARGYALHQALLIIPYYRFTNPGFVAMAKRTVREVTAP